MGEREREKEEYPKTSRENGNSAPSFKASHHNPPGYLLPRTKTLFYCRFFVVVVSVGTGGYSSWTRSLLLGAFLECGLVDVDDRLVSVLGRGVCWLLSKNSRPHTYIVLGLVRVLSPQCVARAERAYAHRCKSRAPDLRNLHLVIGQRHK